MNKGDVGSSVVSEVPETLRRLVLVLTKTFYGLNHYVVMDYIQRNVCIKEGRLGDILKFDQKVLRQLLIALKVREIFYG
jgi:hypothetical protein